jgi:glycosyltransferase involved in cell wall biosynthesis
VWRVAADPFAELADWDVLALPSREEAFGLVLIEALGLEVPVVATRIDGPADIVSPDVGRLVPPDDADALADAITGLLDDPARRVAMGRAGRARVAERYSVQRQAEAIDGCYRDAVSRRRRA